MSTGSETWQDLSHVKKVGIIGGGVAGIQMARSLAALDIQCKIFEKAPNVGGLWRENYAGFGVQVMKQVGLRGVRGREIVRDHIRCLGKSPS